MAPIHSEAFELVQLSRPETPTERTAENVQKPSVLDVSAEAEVNELSIGAAVSTQQNVLQLDVAMDDIDAVHILHLVALYEFRSTRDPFGQR